MELLVLFKYESTIPSFLFDHVLGPNQHYLILNSDILYIVKNNMAITRGFSVGPPFLKCNFGFNDQEVKKTVVNNIYDAAKNVSGFTLNFPYFSSVRGRKPTRKGISDCLGALTLIFVLLNGRVLLCGRLENRKRNNIAYTSSKRTENTLSVSYIFVLKPMAG